MSKKNKRAAMQKILADKDNFVQVSEEELKSQGFFDEDQEGEVDESAEDAIVETGEDEIDEESRDEEVPAGTTEIESVLPEPTPVLQEEGKEEVDIAHDDIGTLHPIPGSDMDIEKEAEVLDSNKTSMDVERFLTSFEPIVRFFKIDNITMPLLVPPLEVMRDTVTHVEFIKIKYNINGRRILLGFSDGEYTVIKVSVSNEKEDSITVSYGVDKIVDEFILYPIYGV